MEEVVEAGAVDCMFISEDKGFEEGSFAVEVGTHPLEVSMIQIGR